jgi:Holliday junction resolvase
MTPEKKVKDAVVKILKQRGAYHFFPVTGGFGRSGIPDIVVCYKGNFIGIECKAGVNKPTALQFAEIDKINKAGGVAFWVSEHNLDNVTKLLDTIDTMQAIAQKEL